MGECVESPRRDVNAGEEAIQVLGVAYRKAITRWSTEMSYLPGIIGPE